MIKAKTIYPLEKLNEFSEYIAKKNKAWIFFLTCFVLLMVSFVTLLVMHIIDVLVIISFAVFLAAVVLFYSSLTWLPRLANKKSPSLNANIIFCFDEEEIKVFEETDTINGMATVKYAGIVKVTEDKKNVYLFISRSSAYIVDKNGFEQGTEQELKDFLLTKGVNLKLNKKPV